MAEKEKTKPTKEQEESPKKPTQEKGRRGGPKFEIGVEK